MRLFRLNVVEERIMARDEEDAILGAFQGVESMEFAGYINVEPLAEPVATVYLTKDQLMMVGRAITTVPIPNTGRNFYLEQLRHIRNGLDEGIAQLAVQTAMVEREEA